MISIMPILSVGLYVLAYIDPGTGSIIVQALVATFVGAAVAVKLFWHRILIFFGRGKTDENDLSHEPGDREKEDGL
jgi:hypothetical protein